MEENKIPIVLCSIFLFSAFIKAKIRNIRFVNMVASTMFGVYLIHDNILVRPFLWKDFFKNADYIFYGLLSLHAICSILLVFIGCIIIDILRMYLLERPLILFFKRKNNIFYFNFQRVNNNLMKIISGNAATNN